MFRTPPPMRRKMTLGPRPETEGELFSSSQIAQSSPSQANTISVLAVSTTKSTSYNGTTGSNDLSLRVARSLSNSAPNTTRRLNSSPSTTVTYGNAHQNISLLEAKYPKFTLMGALPPVTHPNPSAWLRLNSVVFLFRNREDKRYHELASRFLFGPARELEAPYLHGSSYTFVIKTIAGVNVLRLNRNAALTFHAYLAGQGENPREENVIAAAGEAYIYQGYLILLSPKTGSYKDQLQSSPEVAREAITEVFGPVDARNYDLTLIEKPDIDLVVNVRKQVVDALVEGVLNLLDPESVLEDNGLVRKIPRTASTTPNISYRRLASSTKPKPSLYSSGVFSSSSSSSLSSSSSDSTAVERVDDLDATIALPKM